MAASVLVALPGSTASAQAGDQNVNCQNDASIFGTERADVITGTPGNDFINGLGGADIIYGLGGDDILCGGRGADEIEGGDGNDILNGQLGDDVISGGSGEDSIEGWRGEDTIRGGADADLLDGGEGDDRIVGGAGDDVMQGDLGNDTLVADDRDIQLHGDVSSVSAEHFKDTVDFSQNSTGQDVQLGRTSHIDVVIGTENFDIFFRAPHRSRFYYPPSVTLVGRGGDDFFYGALEGDRFIGGAGSDSLSYENVVRSDGSIDTSVTGPVRIDLSVGFARRIANVNSKVDQIEGIEDAFGTSADDRLTGNRKANLLRGLDGNDHLDGGDGHDELEGGEGNDRFQAEDGDDSLDGGGGDDRVTYEDSDTRIVVNLEHEERQVFGASVDTDTLKAVERIYGTPRGDTMRGDANEDGPNFLSGGGGDDEIDGRAGADTLIGGNGQDQILGGEGDDIIAGGPDDDTLYGFDGLIGGFEDEEDRNSIDGGKGRDTCDEANLITNCELPDDCEVGGQAAREGAVAIAAVCAEKIVWTREVSMGEWRIFSMDPDGSGRLDLRAGQEPELSPDGSKILFRRSVRLEDRSTNMELFAMDSDGTDVRRLTTTRDHEGHATWSPDGTRIAFVRVPPEYAGTPFGVPSDVYVMDADGSSVSRLTSDGYEGSWNYRDPTWSPDGTRIAYVGPSPGGERWTEVNMMNPDGSGKIQITSAATGHIYGNLQWSPDGGLFMFVACSGSVDACDLYTVGTDGDIHPDTGRSVWRRITPDEGIYTMGSWSPDGTQVALLVGNLAGDEYDVGTMNSDGSSLTLLFSDGNNDFDPDWGYYDPPQDG